MTDHDQEEVERLARILAVVFHCLRESFPDDFYRRCAFAARAIRELLLRDGVESHAVGGRFTALAVGRFDARYALQGFQGGPEPYPHLWVETEHRLIDLGPHLLPFGSPFPLVPMPALAWNKGDPLPAALAYEQIDVIADHAPFSVSDEVSAQARSFVDCCLDMMAASPLTFLLTGARALTEAEQAGDAWARAVARFQKSVARHTP
jgi:hypothetical protein